MSSIHHQVSATYEGRTGEGRTDVSVSLSLFGTLGVFLRLSPPRCLRGISMTRARFCIKRPFYSFSDLTRQREYLNEDSQRHVGSMKRNKTEADRRYWKIGHQKALKKWKMEDAPI